MCWLMQILLLMVVMFLLMLVHWAMWPFLNPLIVAATMAKVGMLRFSANELVCSKMLKSMPLEAPVVVKFYSVEINRVKIPTCVTRKMCLSHPVQAFMPMPPTTAMAVG